MVTRVLLTEESELKADKTMVTLPSLSKVDEGNNDRNH